MDNFKINVNDNKIDTIGGNYPFITRNGNTYYKSFPVNGLITFNTDEKFIFSSQREIYNVKNNFLGSNYKDDIKELYELYNSKYNIWDYDYIYEVFFRDKAFNFLHDGKPKLFKSATEGNIIVRLLNINTSPHQNLGRKIYSFTSTAYEIAEPTMENYLKYKFYEVGEIQSDYTVQEIKIGQLTRTFNFGTNVIAAIKRKYDFTNKNIAGMEVKLQEIIGMDIEFNSDPYLIDQHTGLMGYKFTFKKSKDTTSENVIRVTGNKSYYKFDDAISFSKNGSLYFNPPTEEVLSNYYNKTWSENNPIDATINFTYRITKAPIAIDALASLGSEIGVGQYYENVQPNSSIYYEIKKKYEHDWKGDHYIKLNSLKSISIEANPGAVFRIVDANDITREPETHIVGKTGILTIDDDKVNISKNLYFVGYTDLSKNDGIIEPKNMDVLVNYHYILEKGTYKNSNNDNES